MIRPVLSLLLALALPCVVHAEQPLSVGHEVADLVLVVKSERKLYLMREGRILKALSVSLGLMPVGAKGREGDFRTPEGRYELDGRNVDSDYFLSIHVSYPNSVDLQRAHAQGVAPADRS